MEGIALFTKNLDRISVTLHNTNPPRKAQNKQQVRRGVVL